MKLALTNKIKHYEMITGYSILDHYLGHGTQGVTFSMGNQVVKISTDFEEARVAKWALAHPHPYLPIIKEVVTFPKNIWAIIREPLADIADVGFIKNFESIKGIDLNNQRFHFVSQLENLLQSWPAEAGAKAAPLLKWMHNNFHIRELLHFNFGMRDDQLVIRDLGTIRLKSRTAF